MYGPGSRGFVTRDRDFRNAQKSSNGMKRICACRDYWWTNNSLDKEQ